MAVSLPQFAMIIFIVLMILRPPATVETTKSAKALMDFGCPERSYRYKDHCYTILGSFATTYEDASDICMAIGGNIASPTDKITYHFMKKLSIRFLTTGYWLGIRKDNENWIYKGDSSKTVIGYNNFDSREPSGDGKCAIMNLRRSLSWMALSCDEVQFYICQYDESKSCASPLIKFQGSCYSFSQERLDLVAAHAVCKKNGGILLEVRSEEENDFIKTVIYNDLSWGKWQSNFTNNPPPKYRSLIYGTWLGIRRNGTSDTWLLDNGAQYDVQDWVYGQPDNANGKENCAVFSWNGVVDLDCQQESRIMCSRKAVAAEISINV